MTCASNGERGQTDRRIDGRSRERIFVFATSLTSDDDERRRRLVRQRGVDAWFGPQFGLPPTLKGPILGHCTQLFVFAVALTCLDRRAGHSVE